MNAKVTSHLIDDRSRCLSVMCEITIGEYLDFIAKTYENRGGIEGQRDALKSKSALQIRNQMVDDVKHGAILPPIVVGITLSEAKFDVVRSHSGNLDELGNDIQCILDDEESSFALIDGMQRTTAMRIAAEQKPEIRESRMRLELWVAKKVNNLLYRMLVLNTGQIPWDIRKQLEVIFTTLTKQVKEAIPGINIYRKEDNQRRTAPIQFQADDVIEMFIAFTSRKEKVDYKEHIAQEFTRLDLVESTNRVDMVNYFIQAFALFCWMDKIFSKDDSGDSVASRQFRNGAALMNSQPMRIGFMTALSVMIFGKPGRNATPDRQQNMFNTMETGLKALFSSLEEISPEALSEFIDVGTLNEVLPRTTSRIGEQDRKFFKEAFMDMFKSIEENDLPSMESCWRAP